MFGTPASASSHILSAASKPTYHEDDYVSQQDVKGQPLLCWIGRQALRNGRVRFTLAHDDESSDVQAALHLFTYSKDLRQRAHSDIVKSALCRGGDFRRARLGFHGCVHSTDSTAWPCEPENQRDLANTQDWGVRLRAWRSQEEWFRADSYTFMPCWTGKRTGLRRLVSAAYSCRKRAGRSRCLEADCAISRSSGQLVCTHKHTYT